MTLGEKIQFQRKRKNMTQEELGEYMEVSRQTVTKWESNQSFPEIKKLVKLSYFFNVSTDYLLKDEIENYEEHLNQYILENGEEGKREKIPTNIKIFTSLIVINLLGIIFLYVNSHINPITTTDWDGTYYYGFWGYLYINEKRGIFFLMLSILIVSSLIVINYLKKKRRENE